MGVAAATLSEALGSANCWMTKPAWQIIWTHELKVR
jgi:hypothetical protein